MMLSIIAGVQEYIQAMVDRISGMKVLILDQETTGIISMVFSQSDILSHEVFLVERIDADSHERMRHLNAVCFLRPTNQNFLLLSKELKSPKYNEYHIFFTNVVPHMRLEQLACCDEHEVVQQVEEFFADVYAVNHEVFSLNLPSTSRLTEEHSRWSSYEESVFERMVEGLLATCLALRLVPTIRYTSSSELTRQVAYRLQQRIAEERGLFEVIDNRPRPGEAPPVILLLDRRNDPVTPLLSQWTYQAMVHELLSMDNNRVDMSKVPGIRPEQREIVMSVSQDQFFEENVLSNFGELGVNIKKYVEQYQSQTKNTAKIESIEEMQRFVDAYPEFRRMSGNVSKHVTVVHELSRVVDQTGLMEASQLEQEIACSESKQEHFKAIVELLRGSSITHMERLRLVLLYTLRYENETSNRRQLKEVLISKGIGEDQVALIDQLLRYAGSHARLGDLFQNTSFLARARSTIKGALKDVENVYTQHKTLVHKVADSLMSGKLKESSYPVVDSARYVPPRDLKVPCAVLFMVGGATFEEARDVAELNKALDGDRSIVLGGTTIHNTRSFLADVAQLGALAATGPE